MAGIAAYGAYVPRYRLGPETAGWNSRVERAVANFDEDSVTMAVAAGIDCLTGRDRNDIDGIIFASTTAPYAEKQCAAIVAAALDLRQDIFATDVANVLRAGTSALRSALDAVAAGSAREVLVVVADSRQGSPRGETERASGDGAAAFVVSADGVIAELAGSHSITDNMLDTWRSPGDSFVRTWEDRFATEEGIERIVPEAVNGYCQRTGITPADAARVALYAPDYRRHGRLARQSGFTEESDTIVNVWDGGQHRRGLRSDAAGRRAGTCEPGRAAAGQYPTATAATFLASEPRRPFQPPNAQPWACPAGLKRNKPWATTKPTPSGEKCGRWTMLRAGRLRPHRRCRPCGVRAIRTCACTGRAAGRAGTCSIRPNGSA